MRGLKSAGLLSVLAAVALPLVVDASATAGATFGSEISVSTITDGTQSAPVIAGNARGGFVVAWQDVHAPSSNEIHAAAYLASGLPFGGEVTIATNGTKPAVATDAQGNFVVVYLNAGGHPAAKLVVGATSSDVVIDTAATAVTPQPAVGMDADGNFVTVYLRGTGAQQQVIARRFNANGTQRPVGSSEDIIVAGGGGCAAPIIAVGDDGHFVVACVALTGNPAAPAISARSYAPNGSPTGAAFIANTQAGSGLSDVRAAVTATGPFLLTWRFDAKNIHGRGFNAAGAALGPEFVVGSADNSLAQGSAAIDATGDSVATWESFDAAGTSSDVFARRFDGLSPLDSDVRGFKANTSHVHNRQTAPSVALDADGDFVIAWQNGVAAADHPDIRAQRFVGPEDVDLTLTITDSQDPVTPGATYSYTYQVSNLHPAPSPGIPGSSAGITAINAAIDTAHDVTLATSVPTGTTFQSISGTGWTCTTPSGGQVSCSLGTVLGHAASAAPVVMSLTAPSGNATVQDTGTVADYQFDSHPANNAGSASTTVGSGGTQPTVQFASASATAAESAGTATVQVRLSAASSQAVTVPYTISGTATNGTDFSVSPASPITIPANSTSATVTINIVDDGTTEPTETVILTLGTPTNATLGSQSSYTLSITDNDACHSSSVVATGANGQPVTFSADCGSLQSVSATGQPGSVPQGVDYPLGFFAYQISGVSAGSTVTLTVTLPAGTAATDWIDCINGSCYRYPTADIAGDVVTVRVADNGAGDSDSRPGFIGSTVAPARSKASSSNDGGSLTWLLLTPLFGGALARRRGNKAPQA